MGGVASPNGLPGGRGPDEDGREPEEGEPAFSNGLPGGRGDDGGGGLLYDGRCGAGGGLGCLLACGGGGVEFGLPAQYTFHAHR